MNPIHLDSLEEAENQSKDQYPNNENVLSCLYKPPAMEILEILRWKLTFSRIEQ